MSRSTSLRRAGALALLLAAAANTACGGPGLAASPLVKVPETPGDEPRCKVAASHDNPLVTEWPASEKANLEARLREGSVVVSYTGCSLRMLPACRARGAYRWRRTTTTTDQVEIHDADELFAKLPLGAVSLEGELQRSGRLAVQTTVSGQFQLGDFDAGTLARGSECEGATHVLGALSVGAFKLRSGGSARVAGSASMSGIGSGGGSSRSEESIVREAGAPGRCEEGDDAKPHTECASPIQMFLQPLPASIADRGPAGTMKVKFLPVRPDEKWEVMVGDRPVCTTPCEKWVDPAMPYTLKYDPGFFQRNELVDIPDLRTHASDERVEVRVRPTRTAEQVLGIVVTTFGGIAVATGTVLTAIGKDLLTPGLITLAAGVATTPFGIWMMLDARAEVGITPMAPRGAALLRW